MKIENILKDWYNEAFGYNYNLAKVLYYHIEGNTLLIFSNWPGMLIGKYGTLIDKYKQILKENNFNYEIKFVELFGYSGVYELKY